MRIRRWFFPLTAAATVGILVAPLPSAEGGTGTRGAPEVRLAGRNSIRGAATAFARVILPRAVTISSAQGSNPDFRVSGPGRFAGFLLQQERADGEVILGGRLPSKGAFPKRDGQREIILSFSSVPGSPFRLPPGRYRLYLIADNAQVKVTFTLHGLSGARKIVPTAAAPFRLQDLPPRIESTPANVIHTAGGVGRLKSRGLIFNSLAIQHPLWVVGEYGRCVYNGVPIQPQPLGWLPLCPAAPVFDREAFVTTLRRVGVTMGGRTLLYGSILGLPPDSWTVLNWYEAAGLVDRMDAIAFWLSLSPGRVR